MEDQKFDGGPAFPSELNVLERPIVGFEGEELEPNTVANYPGMTLRDYFAAKALNGSASKPGAPNYEYEAMVAYKYADAMLKARNA